MQLTRTLSFLSRRVINYFCMEESNHSIMQLRRHERFVFLTCGRVLVIGGNTIAPIAIAFLTLDVSRSDASALGLVMATRGISVIAFLLIGGVLADRFPRRPVMVGSSALATVSQAMTTALAVSGRAQIWELAVLQVPNGASASFLFPAMNGSLPRTVPPSLLRPAIAVSRTGVNIAMIGGAALGGLAVAAVGTGGALAINSAMYLAAALAFTRTNISVDLSRSESGASMLTDLVEGWHDFRSREWLWTTVAEFSIVNAAVAVGFETLGPLVAKLDLGGAKSWGIIVAAQGIGLVVGAAIAALWKPSRPLLAGWSVVFAIVPAFAALALRLPLLVIVATAAMAGIGLEIFGLNWDVMMQREIPSERLSRMYSYDAFGSNAAIPVGQIALTPALAVFGTYGVIWLSGTLVAFMAIIGLWGLKLKQPPTLAGIPPPPERRED
jgi:MFS family permease